MQNKLFIMTVVLLTFIVTGFGVSANAQQNTYTAGNNDVNLTVNWGQLADYTVINGMVENKRNASIKVAFKPHAYDAAGNGLVLPNDRFFGMDYAGPNSLVLPGDKGYFSYAFETAELSGTIAKLSFDLVNPEEFTDNFQFQLTGVTTKTEELDMGTRVAGTFTNTGDTCFLPNIAVVAYKGNDLLLVYQMATSAGGGSATELTANQSDAFNFAAGIGAKSLITLGATKIDVVGGCSSVNFGNAFSSGALTASASPQAAVKQPQQPAQQPAQPSAAATGDARAKVETRTTDLTWNCYGWYSELCEGASPDMRNQCLEMLKNDNPFFLVSCEIRSNVATTVAPAFLIHYYDANGSDLVQGGYPARPLDRVLLPNGTVYMLAMGELANPEDVKTIAVDFDDATTLADIRAQVATTNVNVAYDDFGATVTGVLKNTGSGACFNPSVQIASYRGAALLNVEDLYLYDVTELAPGQSVEFSLQASAPAVLESFQKAGVTDVKVIGACGIQY